MKLLHLRIRICKYRRSAKRTTPHAAVFVRISQKDRGHLLSCCFRVGMEGIPSAVCRSVWEGRQQRQCKHSHLIERPWFNHVLILWCRGLTERSSFCWERKKTFVEIKLVSTWKMTWTDTRELKIGTRSARHQVQQLLSMPSQSAHAYSEATNLPNLARVFP